MRWWFQLLVVYTIVTAADNSGFCNTERGKQCVKGTARCCFDGTQGYLQCKNGIYQYHDCANGEKGYCSQSGMSVICDFT